MKFDYLVVAGGVKEKIPRCAPVVVAVDKGYDYLKAAKINVDIFVGDGDSVKSRKIQASKIYRLSKTKSISDLEYALKMLPRNSTKVILSAHREGERMDHSFVNKLLALKYKNLFFVDEKSWMAGLHNQSLVIQDYSGNCPAGTSFSVISPHAVKVSISGARYNSKNLMLSSPSHGLSNETKASARTKIKVSGRALLFVNFPVQFANLCK